MFSSHLLREPLVQTLRALLASKVFPLFLGFALIAGSASAATPQQRFFAACEKGDAVEIRRSLALGARFAELDSQGRSGLVLAAQSGKIGAVQALLWAGAPAGRRSANGATAYDSLPPPPGFEGDKMSATDFEKLMVATILRCYQFLEAEGRAHWNVTRPGLVLLNEPLIDYTSRPIRDFYWINEKEAKGVAGKDDDGDGFVDDVYGWNEALGAPYALNRRHLDLIESNRPLIARLFEIYNKAQTGGEAEQQALRALDNDYDNPDAELYGPGAGSNAAFLKRVRELAHGSHVAGIVGKASHGKALVHGLSWGQFGGTTSSLERKETIVAMARECSSIEQFVDRYIAAHRLEQVAHARSLSRFVQGSGAGVVNMSLGANVVGLLRKADEICKLAETTGKLEWRSSEAVAERKRDQFIWDCYVYHCLPWAIMFGENPNVLFVPSAGNEGRNVDVFPGAPAVLSLFFPNVLTIAAVDDNSRLASFSNYGATTVNLAAPGVRIPSPTLGGIELLMNGTSMAAPAVAGTAAEIRVLNPKLTAAEVRQLLEYSGTSQSDLAGKVSSGNALSSAAALAAASGNKDWTRVASYFRQRGLLKDAKSEIDRGMAAGPTASLWAQRGLVAQDAEDIAGSRDAFTAGLKLDGKNVPCLEGRCRLAYGLSDWAASAADAETLLQVKPDSELYHDWKAFAYLNAKDGPRTLQAFTDFAEMHKRKGNAATEPVLLGLAVGNLLVGNVAEAQKLYKQVNSTAVAVDALRKNGWTENEIGLLQQVAASFQPKTPSIPPRVEPSPFTPPVVRNDDTLPADADSDAVQELAQMKSWIKANWDRGYSITSVGGFPGHWRVVMTKGTSLGPQSWFTGKPGTFAEGNAFPEKEIADHARAGKMITALAGDSDGWLVVVTKGTSLTDQRFSMAGPFPEAFITRFGKTHQITQIAGFGDMWVGVMSRGTPIDGLKQNYRGPAAFAVDWERAKWDLGMRYGLVAGGSGEVPQWVGVMGAYPKQPAQDRFGPKAFPADDIRSAWGQGKRIISIAGYPRSWVVVMESSTGWGDQVVW